MSLLRQLVSLFLGTVSLTSFLAAVFLAIQMVVIVPGQHPALAAAEVTDTPVTALPQAILLPHQTSGLPIIPNMIESGEWVLPTNGVSLLDWSQTDSFAGYILYGHNWPALLGSLSQVKLGEELVLRYADQKEKTYRIYSKFVVSPQRVDVLRMAAQPGTVLIYTCTGLFDRDRLVVVAQEY